MPANLESFVAHIQYDTTESTTAMEHKQHERTQIEW